MQKSFAGIQDFIEENRPAQRRYAYDYVFYNIDSSKSEAEILDHFDQWIKEQKPLPLRRKISRFLIEIAFRF